MSRIILLMLGVLLAVLSTVDAKSKKDQIHLYQFVNDRCLDALLGGNINLDRDQCVPLDSLSVKAVINPTRVKWLDDVNSGLTECFLAIYSTGSCDGKQLKNVTLPASFGTCTTTEKSTRIRSAKFVCAENITPTNSHATSKFTSTITSTSWSIGKDDVVTPVVSTKTVTITTKVPLSSSSASPSNVARGLEPRATYKNVWLQHPWSGSVICYQCQTNDEIAIVSFECRSGPEISADCGTLPIEVDAQGKVITSTTTVPGWTLTTTVITDGTYTETFVVTATTAAEDMLLEARRSWHKSVAFANPWTKRDRFCADAEWEKRGKPNNEIRLQDVKLDLGGDCEDALVIDAPGLKTSSVHTITTQLGYTNVATVTETTTVFTTPSPSTTFPIGGMAFGKEGEASAHNDL